MNKKEEKAKCKWAPVHSSDPSELSK